MEQLIVEILEELKIELDIAEESNIAVLTSKVKGAIRKVKLARNYRGRFSDEFVEKDIENYYSNIKAIAMYDYVTIGGEYETSHNENGINRAYQKPSECLAGIIPIAILS